MELESLTIGQYEFVQNAFSFGLAVMAATTLFLWFSRGLVTPNYRMAITISGLVTAIAGYHYLQIMLSWQSAFSVTVDTIETTGSPFNQAYRYVDWLLTVPLLLVELILVMKLAAFMHRSLIMGACRRVVGFFEKPAQGDPPRRFSVAEMV